jgi:hypothetical protein
MIEIWFDARSWAFSTDGFSQWKRLKSEEKARERAYREEESYESGHPA